MLVARIYPMRNAGKAGKNFGETKKDLDFLFLIGIVNILAHWMTLLRGSFNDMATKQHHILRVKDVMEKTGFHRRRLKLWEQYGLLKPTRANNKNLDRLYSEDDLKFIGWADQLMQQGLTAETIKVLAEYFRTGKIVSFKWYK